MSKVNVNKREESLGGDRHNVYEHPAMVSVQFSRIQVGGEGMNLFGSTVKSRTVISLKISKAEVARHLSTDWFHGDIHPMVEVLLSPAQFSELLTTMNYGSGVPGTLSKYDGKDYETPVMPSKSEEFKEEVSAYAREAMSDLSDAQKMVNDMLESGKPIGAKGKKDLKDLLVRLDRFAKSTLPFVATQFTKHMNKVVTDSKAEVDSFVTHIVNETGLKSIKDNAPVMIDYEGEDNV